MAGTNYTQGLSGNYMKKENIGYDEEQIKDAETFCNILDTVPKEKQNVFVAIVNAFMDGMAAGQAIATGKR